MRRTLMLVLLSICASAGAAFAYQSPAAQRLDIAQRNLDVDRGRVVSLRVAWDRAVANGDVNDAGRYARAHLAAMEDQRRAEAAVANAQVAYVAEQHRIEQTTASRAPAAPPAQPGSCPQAQR